MAAADGALPVRPKIGAEELRRANGILKKYKEGKTRLEQRIIDTSSSGSCATGSRWKGGAGRQQRRPPARQRLAGELHPVQARGRHGLLSGAHGAAPRGGRPGGGLQADENSAGGTEAESVQTDLFRCLVVQVEKRVCRLWRFLGCGKAGGIGGYFHPQNGPAEPVLGAGGPGTSRTRKISFPRSLSAMHSFCAAIRSWRESWAAETLR